MSASRSNERRLIWAWWFLFPPFALLTLRFTVDRACHDPYDLLSAAASTPAGAWPLAAVYVLAHLWMLTAYLMTVSRTQNLAPTGAEVRTVWHTDRLKLALMAVAFAIEYSPVRFWRLVGSYFGCH